MAEVPQIVLDRLRRKQTGSDAATEHPDANLLSAFAEHALTEEERANVLEHLSHCAECCEIAALSNPELVQEQKVVGGSPSASRSWWRSPVVHWGALTAAALVVLVAVGERMRLREGHSASAPAVASEQMAQKSATPTLETPIPSPQASRPGATANALAPKIAAGADRDRLLARENAKSNAAVSGRAIAAQSAAPSSAKVQNAAPAPLAGNPGSGVAGAVSGAVGGVAGGMPVAPSGASASAELRSPAPPPPAPEASTKSKADAYEQTSDSLAHYNSAPIVSLESGEQSAATPTAKKGSPGVAANRSALSLKQTIITARWSISDSGVLQRSVDGGRTWKAIAVADGTTFRTVAAIGNDVWAGGSGGALFHSADTGDHWSPVRLQADSRALSGDIVRIEFTDHANGTVVTSTGETWATSDGGAHWH